MSSKPGAATSATVPVANDGIDNEEASAKVPDWKPSSHELIIIITLSIISLMVALDASVITTALSAMVIDLHADTTAGLWVGTAYLMTNAVTMPFIAAVSDIFGRPICLIASLIVFSVGTIVCCVAQTITTLLVGRSFQGIGGGGILVVSLVVFTDIVPLRYRPKWYGAILGSWVLGSCTGPLIGGVIGQNTTWRWVFYMMFPLLAFGLVAVPSLLTLKPREATFVERLARVDWIGGFLFISSLTTLLIAISWGGSQFSWSSVQTIVPFVLGAVGLGFAILWEAFFAKEPFLRRTIFHDVASTATLICGCIQGLILYGALYYVAYFFIAVKEYSEFYAGLALLPAMFFLVPGSIVTGALVTRLGSYRWAIWMGWVIGTIGAGLTTIWDEDTSVPVWVISLVILGFGQGTILNAQTFATQAQCKPGDEAAAAAMYGFMRQLGAALGVGIGTSIFQNVMALKLGWEGLDTSIAQNSEVYAFVLLESPESDFKSQVIAAYVFGFRGVFRAFLGLSGVAFFLSLLIKHHDMNKAITTEHRLHESRVSKMFQGKDVAVLQQTAESSSDAEGMKEQQNRTEAYGTVLTQATKS